MCVCAYVCVGDELRSLDGRGMPHKKNSVALERGRGIAGSRGDARLEEVVVEERACALVVGPQNTEAAVLVLGHVPARLLLQRQQHQRLADTSAVHLGQGEG